MAAARLRLPTLACAALSIGLNIAIIGTSGRTLSRWNTQQKTDVWLLPIWPNHFNLAELQTLVGASASIVFLNAIVVLALFIQSLPANILVLLSAALSTGCSLLAIILPAVVNQKAPTRDTLQTWTCRWSSMDLISQGRNSPEAFGTICHETRFAYFTTIPVFIVQLLLLAVAFYVVALGARRSGHGDVERLGSSAEKGQIMHELRERNGVSFDTKASHSPESRHEAVMPKNIAFA